MWASSKRIRCKYKSIGKRKVQTWIGDKRVTNWITWRIIHVQPWVLGTVNILLSKFQDLSNNSCLTPLLLPPLLVPLGRDSVPRPAIFFHQYKPCFGASSVSVYLTYLSLKFMLPHNRQHTNTAMHGCTCKVSVTPHPHRALSNPVRAVRRIKGGPFIPHLGEYHQLSSDENPCYMLLYSLVDRDPYRGLSLSLYIYTYITCNNIYNWVVKSLKCYNYIK